MKLVIVGGVAGGASAAARSRRLSESAEIVLFERGPDVSFANCGLPYYIGGEISDRDRLLVTKPSLLSGRYRLDVRTGTEVVKIDRERKAVVARKVTEGSIYEESYDKLILAPGAAPLRPPIPGIDLPGIHTLRNLVDVDRIKSEIDRGIDRAVIIGAGFIGLELAENLVRRGVKTTIVELQDQVLPPLDSEMTSPITKLLRSRGVDVVLGDSATSFERSEGELLVKLNSGRSVSTQLVLLGIGVRPESRLAADAGLSIGTRGGIQVDDRMQTDDPSIYAVGDAVEIRNFMTGEPAQVPLAGPANRQGRIAADNIFGRDSRFRGTQGTAILRVFDLTAALTGETEKSLKRGGKPYEKIYIHPMNHASYYPDARPMSIKVLFEPQTGLLLGAQIVGQEGVDTRINVLAVAIQARMTVFDLEEAELAYAPQFGSAKDPINMAGFVASAVVRGDYPQTHVDDLKSDPTSNPILIDVRTRSEFAAGHIPKAENLPLEELREHLAEIPRDRRVIVNCQVGMRGYMATLILRDAGIDAVNLGGGYKTYQLFHPDE